jgi:transcriptional regulator with XRE-family HTH domain
MFGKRLADERRRLGRSQDDFARAISIGRSGYASVEGERVPFDLSRLLTLGETEGVDLWYVLTGKSTAQVVAQQINWNLFEGIWMGIHNWSISSGIQIPPEKQILLLKLLYQKMASEERVDAQSLHDALRLVA